jgi:UDP-galactopyranose mutase
MIKSKPMKKVKLHEDFNLAEYVKSNNIDIVIVGAGLSGSVIAEKFTTDKLGKVLIVEQRNHLAGNIYTEKVRDIHVHMAGSHIFHTNNDAVYNYLSNFTTFSSYKHKVFADTGFEFVSMPFNIQTMYQILGVSTIEDVKVKIDKEKTIYALENPEVDLDHPSNFEEQAIAIVGLTLYEQLIKHYTEKQWGREAKSLPAEIIKRLPLRWNSDTTYFNNAKYQGIPVNGYTEMIENMLASSNIHVIKNLHCTLQMLQELQTEVQTCMIFYSGGLDELFDYELGLLEYRTLKFKTELLEIDSYQGTSVINYTGTEKAFTRITEHKYYMDDIPENYTIITKEFSDEHQPENKTIPYYPIGDAKNVALHKEYVQLALQTFGDKFIPIGRLATYKYIDMDKTVELALDIYYCQFKHILAEQLFNNKIYLNEHRF